MTRVLRFPARRPGVEAYAAELEDLVEPLQAICAEASTRLDPDQRLRLDDLVHELVHEAAEVLTADIAYADRARYYRRRIRECGR